MEAMRIAGAILWRIPGTYRRNWEYNIKIFIEL
jgi:hypothetical protein